MNKYISILFLSLLGLISCDSIESAKENAEKAATAAQESREEIANSRLLGRASGASHSRREALRALREETAFEQKVTEAVKFVVAFEFQVWTAQKYDTLAYKDIMLKSGIEEFFRSLTAIFGGNTNYISQEEISPASIFSKEDAKNFLAISAALHKKNPFSDLMEDRHDDHTSMSLLDIFEATLLRIVDYENKAFPYDDFKDYEKIIYRYKPVVFKLLQSRMNALLLIALSKSTNILIDDTLSWLRLGPSGILYFAPPILSQYLWPYDTHFADMNEAQRRYTLKVFEHIEKAERIMVSGGFKPQIDPIIAEQMGSINMDPIDENKKIMDQLHQEQATSYKDYVKKYTDYATW